MFVTFEYDAAGKNIGRSIFMADSTFVRSTTFENDAQGTRTKEKSINFDDLSTGYTVFGDDAGKSTISVFDQFGQDELGGRVSFAAAEANNYDIYQRNAVINKMRYTYDGQGNLTRIDVNDKTGGLLYYARPNAGSGISGKSIGNGAKTVTTVRALGKARYLVRAVLAEPGAVAVHLFSLTGRRSEAFVNEKRDVGTNDIVLDFATHRIGAGVFILQVTIDGKNALSRKIMVQSNGRGGVR